MQLAFFVLVFLINTIGELLDRIGYCLDTAFDDGLLGDFIMSCGFLAGGAIVLVALPGFDATGMRQVKVYCKRCPQRSGAGDRVFILALADRIYKQSELLSKRAEK